MILKSYFVYDYCALCSRTYVTSSKKIIDSQIPDLENVVVVSEAAGVLPYPPPPSHLPSLLNNPGVPDLENVVVVSEAAGDLPYPPPPSHLPSLLNNPWVPDLENVVVVSEAAGGCRHAEEAVLRQDYVLRPDTHLEILNKITELQCD